jgi:hypothetical protein
MTSGRCNVDRLVFLVETKCVRSEVGTGCVLRVWVNLKPKNTVITALGCAGSLKHPFFYSVKICAQRIRTFLYMKQLCMQTEDGFHMSEHRTVGFTVIMHLKVLPRPKAIVPKFQVPTPFFSCGPHV